VEIDTSRPSAARVYDYFLGGAHNFEVDRALARQIEQMTPNVAEAMRANRAFLRRAVRLMVGEGITQFLDIGSGIPTVGNVHDIAQGLDPKARVVYVDIDPIAVAHSRSLLAENDGAHVVQADLREPQRILAEVLSQGLLDLDRPVGLLLAGVVHFVEDPAGCVATLRELREAMAPGSFLLISHATADGQPTELVQAQRLSARTATEIVLRRRDEIAAFFGNFTLLEPGLVQLPLWRPDSPEDVGDHPERTAAYGGVARKVENKLTL
jgi:hypothetical protein